MALHGSMALSGAQIPTLDDFSAAFAVVTIISITATVWNLRFSPTAGEEISGYKVKRTKGAAAEG